MKTLVLLIIEVLLIVLAILLHILWAIFPEWGSTTFFILLTLDLIAMLGLFVWYMMVYQSGDIGAPEVVMMPAAPMGGSPFVPKLKPLGSPRSSSSKSRKSGLFKSSSSSSNPRSSSSSSSSSGSGALSRSSSPRSLVSATRTAPACASGGAYPLRNAGGFLSPLRTAGTGSTVLLKKTSFVVREEIKFPDLWISHGDVLASDFRDLSILTNVDFNKIFSLYEKHPHSFPRMLSKMKGINDLGYSNMHNAYLSNYNLTPEYLALMFIYAASTRIPCIIYITKLNSFYIFYISYTGEEILTINTEPLYPEDIDMIKYILHDPYSLKLYMRDDNRVGKMEYREFSITN